MVDQPNSHIKELLVNYFNCLERFNFSKAGELLRMKGVSLRLDPDSKINQRNFIEKIKGFDC